jgi:hypothetical protein
MNPLTPRSGIQVAICSPEATAFSLESEDDPADAGQAEGQVFERRDRRQQEAVAGDAAPVPPFEGHGWGNRIRTVHAARITRSKGLENEQSSQRDLGQPSTHPYLCA